MAPIKSFKDLRVYQLSLQYLDELYEVAYSIPHLELRTQLIKSGEAISPLIAEGFSKQRNPKEASRFYEMAMAESDEVCVHLAKAIILSKRFSRISSDRCRNLSEKYTGLSKQLNKLSTTWRKFSNR